MKKTLALLLACGCLFSCSKPEKQQQVEPITIKAPSSVTITRMKPHSEPITITGWNGRGMVVEVKDDKILKADYSWAGGTLNLVAMEVGSTTVTLSYQTAKATINVTVLSDK